MEGNKLIISKSIIQYGCSDNNMKSSLTLSLKLVLYLCCIFQIYWSAAATHLDEENFEDVKRFDPSRYEGAGPIPYTFVPFGGGPRMCLGKEFARLEVLVFLHYIVTSFKWDLLIPDEKIIYDPMATPAEGLPIRLHGHPLL